MAVTSNRLLKNPRFLLGLAILATLGAMAVFAASIAPLSPTTQSITKRLLAPGSGAPGGGIYLLGTDQYGRDVLSRLLFGIRLPLVIAFSSAILGGLVGLGIGLPAGYFGGLTDGVLSAATEIQLAVPFLLVGLLVLVLFGSNPVNIVAVFVLLSWPVTARVARSAALSIRSELYIEAARSAGASNRHILLHHVLPNALAPVLVVTAVQVATFIIYEAAFGFFGMGVPPPEPTWGNMLADSRNYLRQAWWIAVFPGLGIVLVALAANLLGEGIRQAMGGRE